MGSVRAGSRERHRSARGAARQKGMVHSDAREQDCLGRIAARQKMQRPPWFSRSTSLVPGRGAPERRRPPGLSRAASLGLGRGAPERQRPPGRSRGASLGPGRGAPEGQRPPGPSRATSRGRESGRSSLQHRFRRTFFRGRALGGEGLFRTIRDPSSYCWTAEVSAPKPLFPDARSTRICASVSSLGVGGVPLLEPRLAGGRPDLPSRGSLFLLR